jgi:hypothetical protein
VSSEDVNGSTAESRAWAAATLAAPVFLYTTSSTVFSPAAIEAADETTANPILPPIGTPMVTGRLVRLMPSRSSYPTVMSTGYDWAAASLETETLYRRVTVWPGAKAPT